MIALRASNINQYWLLMRANKPIGSYLLLWPTLWGLFLAAGGVPSWDMLLIFALGVFVMRSAGCVINDYADRKVDGSVARTKDRPLPAGKVNEREAKQLFGLLVLIAFVLVLFLNWQTIVLSVVALLLASAYPFMKRYTHLPQLVLGAAFAWSIPMAFMAVTETLPAWMWAVYIANLLWTTAYDTQYAMVDRRYDLEVGIKSTAILFGKFDLVAIILLQGATLGLLAWVFYIQQLGAIAYLGLLVSVGLFAYQYYLCRNREEQNCFKAFLHNNWVGMALAIGILAGLIF